MTQNGGSCPDAGQGSETGMDPPGVAVREWVHGDNCRHLERTNITGNCLGVDGNILYPILVIIGASGKDLVGFLWNRKIGQLRSRQEEGQRPDQRSGLLKQSPGIKLSDGPSKRYFIVL